MVWYVSKPRSCTVKGPLLLLAPLTPARGFTMPDGPGVKGLQGLFHISATSLFPPVLL